MKNYIIVALALVFGANLVAQTKTAQTQTEQTYNTTVIRLIILNDNNQMLMRNTEYGWMTPAIRFDSRQTFNQLLDDLAATYGIKIKNPKLSGLFTYKYKFKPDLDIRQFYVANYKEGQIISPIDETVKWLSIDESIKKLSETVNSLGEMTNQVVKYPDTIWGASFILSRVDSKLISEVEESFYPLSN